LALFLGAVCDEFTSTFFRDFLVGEFDFLWIDVASLGCNWIFF
jgi:hypothetical protein